MIVCDSHVLISALLFPGGSPDKVFQRILSGRLDHATSPEILTEIEGVLTRKFSKLQERIPELLDLIASVSTLVYPKMRIQHIKADPPDNRILECAVSAEAQFLVSGDRKHMLPLRTFRGIHIVSPSEFLALLMT